MPGPPATLLRALDSATGEKRCGNIASPAAPKQMRYSGLLAPQAGIGSRSVGRTRFALDSAKGKSCGGFLGGDTGQAPILFTLEGHQVIAIARQAAHSSFSDWPPELI